MTVRKPASPPETLIADLLRGLAPEARLLGLDLGKKTIGLALSDVSRTVASPLLTIRRTKLAADLERLTALAAEHGVGAFVLGLPVNMDGSEGPRCQATRQFAADLAKVTDLPIALWDERLSTRAAEKALLAANVSRRRRAEVVDKVAATVILQGFLDRLRHEAPPEAPGD